MGGRRLNCSPLELNAVARGHMDPSLAALKTDSAAFDQEKNALTLREFEGRKDLLRRELYAPNGHFGALGQGRVEARRSALAARFGTPWL